MLKTDYKLQSDDSLMADISHGNIQAFDELYKRYSSRLLHYFYRMLGNNESVAQDLLQNLFLKIIENPKRYKKGHKFSSWIFTIANNMCKNEYRNNETHKRLEREIQLTYNLPVQDGPEQTFTNQEFTSALFNELNQLDHHHKSVFLLRYREQLSIKEISSILSCSEGTVKSRLFYTAKKLADKLKTFHPNHSEV